MSARAWTSPGPPPKFLVRCWIRIMDSLTVAAPLRKSRKQTKKPLKRSASRTGAKPRRGTTLIRAPPRGGGLTECHHTPALSRALPSRPMPCGQSAAQLQDHVRPALPYPFSPPGALFDVSSGVLFFSSSLRLFNCLKCFVVYTLSPPLSTAKRTENPVCSPKNISEAHKAPEKPGKILRQKRELDCKTPVKLLSYSA